MGLTESTQLYGDLSKEDYTVYESLTPCLLKLSQLTSRQVSESLVVDLHQNHKVLLKFLEGFATFSDIRDYAKRLFSNNMHNTGFTKQNLKTKNGLQFEKKSRQRGALEKHAH